MRAQAYSWDPVSQETKVSPLICQLARLTDPASIPRVVDEIAVDGLSTPEAYVISLMTFELRLATILESSLMNADETLRFLARMIGEGHVAIEANAA
jgi:hypothetical protein